MLIPPPFLAFGFLGPLGCFCVTSGWKTFCDSIFFMTTLASTEEAHPRATAVVAARAKPSPTLSLGCGNDPISLSSLAALVLARVVDKLPLWLVAQAVAGHTLAPLFKLKAIVSLLLVVSPPRRSPM